MTEFHHHAKTKTTYSQRAERSISNSLCRLFAQYSGEVHSLFTPRAQTRNTKNPPFGERGGRNMKTEDERYLFLTIHMKQVIEVRFLIGILNAYNDTERRRKIKVTVFLTMPCPTLLSGKNLRRSNTRFLTQKTKMRKTATPVFTGTLANFARST